MRHLIGAIVLSIAGIAGISTTASAGGNPGGYTIPTPIVMCESGGNYKAENPTSTASGAYQIIDGTWNGFGGYRHAADAPRNVQDLKAAIIWNGGKGRSQWECKG